MIRMKKIAIAALALVVSTTAHAQFESGKQYIGASMTGLNLSYNGSQDLNLGIQAKTGYFVEDDWMLLGQVEYNHSGLEGVKDYFSVGAQARYYIEQNGLYLGGGVKLAHSGGYNDFMPGVEVGYAFFLGKSVTLEPAIYYDQSFKKHVDYSTVGLKLGIGIYL